LNGEGVNVLKIYYDLPKGNDAWNIDPNYRKQREDTIKILSHEIIESQEGILIVFQLSVGEKSKARMIYEIYPSIYYIETHLEIDWNEEHRFLRVEFDTSIQNRFLFSGQPYSLIKRPTIREAPLEKGKWEFPGQYFIAMDNANDKGLAVLVTNRYGFDCEGGRMGMSLLRSPSFDPPDKNACAWYDPKTLPDRQKIKDLGHHILSWSIMPYIGDIKTGKVYEHAINYAYKPLYRRIGDVHQIDLPKTRQSVDSMAIQIDNPKIFFSVAKYPYGENKMKSIILRFVELYGDNESFRLSWSKDFQICEVVEVDLLEFPLKNKNKSSDSIHLSESGDSILLEISPFEIKTFKLIFK
jgi:alpha-mannosidase